MSRACNDVRKQRVEDKHNRYDKQYLHREKAKAVPDGYAYHKGQCPYRVNFGGYQHTGIKVVELKYTNNAEQHKHSACDADNVADNYVQIFQLLIPLFAARFSFYKEKRDKNYAYKSKEGVNNRKVQQKRCVGNRSENHNHNNYFC